MLIEPFCNSAGVCSAVHLCEKTDYALRYEVSQRTARPVGS